MKRGKVTVTLAPAVEQALHRHFPGFHVADFQVNPTASGDTLTYDAVNGWDETRGDTGYKFHFPAGEDNRENFGRLQISWLPAGSEGLPSPAGRPCPSPRPLFLCHTSPY
jgi:hypothetical protein